MTEQQARDLDHKWSPVRHHIKSFPNGIQFEGDALRVYARLYCRDLYLHQLKGAGDVPPMETVFVMSIGTGDENDDIYNEFRDELGAFVESANIETEIDIETNEY